MKILIIKTGALGDIIRTTYALPGVFEKYHNVEVHWVVKSPGEDLLKANKYIKKIIMIDQLECLSSSYDLVYSLDDEEVSASVIDLIGYKKLTGVYPTKYGLKYTKNSALWFDMGLISKFGKLKADELKKQNTLEHNKIFEGIFDIQAMTPYFENNQELMNEVSFLYEKSYYHIGINPCAGNRWPAKNLSLKEFERLVELILFKGIPCIEKDIAINIFGVHDRDDYVSIAKKYNKNVVIRDTTKSLQYFAVSVSRCDYLITSDSLALHLAIAQKVKNCSFYSPTSAAEIGTFGTGVKVLSTGSEYCSYLKNVNNKTITADRIYSSILDHITKSK